MGRVRGIIKIDVTFNGDATMDTIIDVIGQTKIDCSAENIAETDSLVTFPDAPAVGDCVSDDIRTDGKDPTKYTIIKNDDGTLTFTSDGYPNLKMTKQSLAAKEDLVGHYMGRVRGIIKIDVTFNGDAAVNMTLPDWDAAGLCAVAPHAPCRPLRWLTPERDYFKAEFAKLEGIAASRDRCAARAEPAPAMAGAGARPFRGEVCGARGLRCAARAGRCAAGAGARLRQLHTVKVESVGLEGFAVQPVRWLVPGRAFVVAAPPVQCRPQ